MDKELEDGVKWIMSIYGPQTRTYQIVKDLWYAIREKERKTNDSILPTKPNG
jgi:hypothetical protein